MKLFFEAVVKFLMGVLLVAIPLFVSAGTWHYPNGWLLMVLLFIPMFIAGLIMLVISPDLLKKRLDVKEKQTAQKGVLAASGAMFLTGFVVAGLDHRFDWSAMPAWLVITAAVVFLGAYGLYAEVMRENIWLSRTVKVEQGQKVVDTGLYGIVRHPMYLATVLLFMMIPLILGSWFAVPVFLAYPVIIIRRLLKEEELLSRELPGYELYKKKVRYRLFPFIW